MRRQYISGLIQKIVEPINILAVPRKMFEIHDPNVQLIQQYFS